jgi:hypothetical protein
VAVALAIQAMLLRALLPVGWMPSTDSHAPLIICPMMGGMMHAAATHRGLPQHHSPACPFTASLAQLAAPAISSPLRLPPNQPAVAHAFAPAATLFAALSHRSQSPRAPPLSA